MSSLFHLQKVFTIGPQFNSSSQIRLFIFLSILFRWYCSHWWQFCCLWPLAICYWTPLWHSQVNGIIPFSRIIMYCSFLFLKGIDVKPLPLFLLLCEPQRVWASLFEACHLHQTVTWERLLLSCSHSIPTAGQLYNRLSVNIWWIIMVIDFGKGRNPKGEDS